MKKNKILIVDDELSVRTSLEMWFLEDGFCVETAASGEEGLNKMHAGPYDILLLDIKMPGMDGITLQKKIKEIDDRAMVIIMTAYAAVDTAVEALKLGAFDYISKPFEPEDLSRLVFNALKQKELADENMQLKEQMSELMEVEEIIGVSSGINKIKEMVGSVAKIDSSVLIRGEGGTGKEHIARVIHHQSNRRYSPFVIFNNSRAIPESLLESELYGHEKGAIKNAQCRRKGKIELANGGILAIADIDAFTLQMQGDLIRVLESKKFMRLGGREEVEVDFRLICMTKKDLEKLVKKEQFREDLYYWINVCSIFIPPLRERSEDILPLARHFITKFSRKFGIQEKRLHPEAEKCLLGYSWPGNVLELENVIERAQVIGKESEIIHKDFPFHHDGCK